MMLEDVCNILNIYIFIDMELLWLAISNAIINWYKGKMHYYIIAEHNKYKKLPINNFRILQIKQLNYY